MSNSQEYRAREASRRKRDDKRTKARNTKRVAVLAFTPKGDK